MNENVYWCIYVYILISMLHGVDTSVLMARVVSIYAQVLYTSVGVYV